MHVSRLGDIFPQSKMRVRFASEIRHRLKFLNLRLLFVFGIVRLWSVGFGGGRTQAAFLAPALFLRLQSSTHAASLVKQLTLWRGVNLEGSLL